MRNVKATEIEGDISVGRHLNVGGDTRIQGNTLVKKNLRVEGWLDAENIKGANRGLFDTLDALREACPSPLDGWHALVGDNLPAKLYVARGGEWVDTYNFAGEISLDLQRFNDAVDELSEELDERYYSLRDRVVVMSEAEYENLLIKDDEKFYFLYEDE